MTQTNFKNLEVGQKINFTIKSDRGNPIKAEGKIEEISIVNGDIWITYINTHGFLTADSVTQLIKAQIL